MPLRLMLIRPGDARDLAFLEEMLFEAFFWDESVSRPSLDSFREQPEFSKILAGWGRRGDRALVAAASGEPLGAAWFRLWTDDVHSYGFVSVDIPEVGVGVAPEHRSKGVGRALLRALVQAARADGYPALSLSVAPGNRARHLYEAEGFRKVGESGTSWTLMCPLR